MPTARRSLLGNRNFVLLWCAYAVSAFGDHLSEMAILKTQHAVDAGVDLTPLMARMTFVFFVPFFLFGPVCGALADRLSRRSLMIAADVVRAAILFGFVYLIAFFCPLGSWGAFLPLAAVGCFAAVFSPARNALLPTLIRKDQLISANAMIKGLGVIASIAASVAGGYLAKRYAPSVSFRLDGVTFLVSALLVYGIVSSGRGPVACAAAAHGPGWLEQLTGGVRYIVRHRRVMQLFGVGLVFWGAGSAVFTVVPAVVKEVYGYADYQTISYFRGLMGVGMLAGAVLLALLSNALRSEIAITWALIGAGCWTLILTLTTFVGWPGRVLLVIGAVGTVGMGACGTGIVASYNALLQRMVPNRYRGRVFGVLDLWTTFGLLLATGLLGIPQWRGIDRWVGFILLAMATVFLTAGAVTLVARLRASPHRFEQAFWMNVTELLARFWYRLRVDGPCYVPRRGPVVVVANHTSSIDPLLLTVACRYRICSFMIAREYSNLPLFRYFVRLIDCVPVRRDGRDAEATKAAIRHLRTGKALGIFIQGRIASPGEVLEPKDGPAMLALRTGATVVPAHISGTEYRKGVAPSFFARHRARVRYGKPVDLSEFAGVRGRSGVQQATKKIHAAILSLARERVAELVRDGDSPRCKKCSHSLVGLDTPQCPQCGQPFVADALGIGPARSMENGEPTHKENTR